MNRGCHAQKHTYEYYIQILPIDLSNSYTFDATVNGKKYDVNTFHIVKSCQNAVV